MLKTNITSSTANHPHAPLMKVWPAADSSGAFGDRDWVANGVLFAVYHLHVPWAIPATLVDAFILAYPTKRYRSAWIGISVHSAQSVFFALAVLAVVLT